MRPSNGMTHPATDGTAFTFLGFTYIWGKSRAGKNVVRLVTAKNRYARALAAVAATRAIRFRNVRPATPPSSMMISRRFTRSPRRRGREVAAAQ